MTNLDHEQQTGPLCRGSTSVADFRHGVGDSEPYQAWLVHCCLMTGFP